MVLTSVEFRQLYLQMFDVQALDGDGWRARPQYQDLPRDGAYRLNGTERSSRDARTLKRSWTLIQPDPASLDDAYASLKYEIGRYARLTAVSAAGVPVWTDAELLDVKQGGPPRRVSGRMRGVGMPVVTEFMLPTPGWFAETLDTLSFSDIYDPSDGGDLLLMDVAGPVPGTLVPMTWMILGREDVTRMTIRVVSGSGTVSKLRLVNHTTGYTLQWQPTVAVPATLTTGQNLVIDVGNESIVRHTTDAYNQLTLGTHTRWFKLAPGINQVDVQLLDTATDDSTVLSVSYYPVYP